MTIYELLLCDDVIRDEKTGKNTAIGIFDRISSTEVPAIHPKMVVFFRYQSPEKESKVRFVFDREGVEKPILDAEFIIKQPDNYNFGLLGHVLRLNNILLEVPGTYWIRIYYKGRSIGKAPFYFEIKEGEK